MSRRDVVGLVALRVYVCGLTERENGLASSDISGTGFEDTSVF